MNRCTCFISSSCLFITFLLLRMGKMITRYTALPVYTAPIKQERHRGNISIFSAVFETENTAISLLRWRRQIAHSCPLNLTDILPSFHNLSFPLNSTDIPHHFRTSAPTKSSGFYGYGRGQNKKSSIYQPVQSFAVVPGSRDIRE